MKGNEARKDGELFEEKIFNLLKNKESVLRKKLELKIKKDFILTENSTFEYELLGNKKVESIFGDYTTSKSDINIKIKDLNVERHVGLSLKKNIGTTQAMITSVSRFFDVLEKKNIEFNSNVLESIQLICGELFKEEICSNKESFRNKRHYIDELPLEMKKDLVDFLKDNLSNLLKILIKEGSILDKKYHADYTIYNLVNYSENLNYEVVPIIVNNEDLIEYNVKKGLRLTNKTSRNGQNIYLGDYNLKRKGSGTEKARKYLQSQSRFSLRKYKDIYEKLF